MAEKWMEQPIWDPIALAAQLRDITKQTQVLMRHFTPHEADAIKFGVGEWSMLGFDFFEFMTRMMTDPAVVARAQIGLFHNMVGIWQKTAVRLLMLRAREADIPKDKRFKHPEWSENAVFSFVKDSYLVAAASVLSAIREVKGMDEASARKVDFYTRQLVDALSPSNFVATNPEVLTATLASGGQNLLRGLENLLADLERGKGRLAITMTDMKAFRLGENIAMTPGKVIYQNELMQLIQYTPSTREVRRRPLLIVPPWINKFYVLDLQPKNSFIKWAVDQGHTVLVISWVNPDKQHAEKTFENYLLEGPLAALDAIESATGEHSVNAIGYCLGGTLLASTLAYLVAKGEDRITSVTYFATLVDFTEVGDMAVFIDEEQLAYLERRMRQHGYLEAHQMATTFNMLRANDLIWSFVVSNYLLGKKQVPGDLLFWNSDSTRMPAAMHSFYLRKMYHENLLAKPGGITLADTPIDLSKVRTPSFILATREDHIAPWKSTYAATSLYSGPVKFILSDAGHMAGVISPPGTKYGHWVNDDLPPSPDEWFVNAAPCQRSWWLLWDEWVTQFDEGRVPARDPGSGGLPIIENAPGSYVCVRSMAL
ncbi:PHA/PHB synthase family protein [Bradyrhizobium zhanjiangense]|uniref:Poly(3-hydroxyalkanoate) synthetase n=1 Tax=Bradyrhizobium zhanjiangense TaxID=1325107 RepID=A0A4Q0SP88_9BRAD|nr:class I poly(R)-hydroxyalkanoic acid synthase [Bradyrhizobium zhanjiangense]RXH41683.1 poly(3-hydroxyalkanoate) synthetase [Bradyrhizobium zhanjiangense]